MRNFVLLLILFLPIFSVLGQPNIILIIADDLGYNDISLYGSPTIRTPNLDRLIIEGAKLTQFYVAASICTPSRSSMLTGRLPIRNGIYANLSAPMDTLFRVFYPSSVGCLPETETTIAQLLHDNGYSTALIGKWHLGHNHEKKCLPGNGQKGFDIFYGLPYSHEEGYPGPFPENIVWPAVPLYLNDKIVEQPFNMTDLTPRFTNAVLDLIDSNCSSGTDGKNPCFIHFAFENPHVPLFTSPEFVGKSKRGKYGDSVEEMDDSVGQVIAKIKQKGFESNTLVFFSSDNGAWVNPSNGLGGNNGDISYIDGGSNAPFRDGKGSTWEGGVRVPAIVWWPSHIPAGTLSMAPVTNLDLFPTFLEAASIDLDDEIVLDGSSILSLLTSGANPDVSPHEFIYLWREKDLYAVRYGQYKAHFITRSGFNSSDEGTYHDPPLLFNVENDPGESYPLDSSTYSKIIDVIQKAAAHHINSIEKADSEYLKQRWRLVPCCHDDNFVFLNNLSLGGIWDYCTCSRHNDWA